MTYLLQAPGGLRIVFIVISIVEAEATTLIVSHILAHVDLNHLDTQGLCMLYHPEEFERLAGV
ncbi:MAG: hypothetical protein ABI068_07445, partial [Ktedonobacterales bacterium]